MRLEAITWERLTEALADRAMKITAGETTAGETTAEDGSGWLRIGIDGAPAARPGELADRVAEALRLRGRSVLVAGTGGFLRPASLRYEYGREDPDTY